MAGDFMIPLLIIVEYKTNKYKQGMKQTLKQEDDEINIPILISMKSIIECQESSKSN